MEARISKSISTRLATILLTAGVLIGGPAATACAKTEASSASQPSASEKKQIVLAKAEGGEGAKSVATQKIDGNEWASWRGPENTGVSRATGLPEKWDDKTDPVIWKREDMSGRTTPIIMNGNIYVIRSTVHAAPWEMSQEEVVCADAMTGDVKWRYAFPLFHTDVPQDRVGWAAMVGDPETGNVYAHGVQGLFFCFSPEGKVVWQKSLTEEFGRVSGYGGRTHTPMIDQDLVIISSLFSSMGAHGKGLHRYLAMDKRTGEIRWWSGPGEDPNDTTYAVPAVTVINGVRQLVTANADGNVYGLKASTGEKIWTFQFSKRGLNTSIVADGKYVYASHSEENIDNSSMGRVVCIDASGEGDVTKTHEVWRRDACEAGYCSPALHDGRLYVVENSSMMEALDAKTGELLWKKKLGRAGKASPVFADGKIYYGDEIGNFYILKPGDKDCEVLSKKTFKTPEGFGSDIKSGVAVAHGRVYLMTRDALYCAGDPKNKPAPISIDPLPPTGPADSMATHLQIIPAEIHIPKDGEVKLTARTFDAKGALIGEAKATWTLENLKGNVSPDGVFVPDPAMNGQFGLVKADVDGLKGEARIRVLPTLPYSQDFEKVPVDLAPSFWVGASKVKFAVKEIEGGKVMVKNTNPRFQRANVFIGPPDMSGYTIQADVYAGEGGALPEMGVINSRYIFDIMGSYKQLRLIGWIPMPRITKTVPFEVERGVWYTLKLRVDPQGDKALVRGKVWKRGEAEPDAWSIEMEDPLPYTHGSPGLSTFSPSEIWYDNVKITKSE